MIFGKGLGKHCLICVYVPVGDDCRGGGVDVITAWQTAPMIDLYGDTIIAFRQTFPKHILDQIVDRGPADLIPKDC